MYNQGNVGQPMTSVPPSQQYGAPAPPPQYGAPAPPQQYGAPAPPPQYGAPPQQYGAPPQQYGAPAPPQQYGAPPQQYGAPPAPPGLSNVTPVVQWMPKPETFQGCPPGLEYLLNIDQVLVHQQVELLEAFTGWETMNKYQVKNSVGQQVYFAAEESDACMRQCCGPHRGFLMHITDNFGQEVVRINRQFKCCAGCPCCAGLDCCAMEVEVEAPVGTVVGYVRQTFSCWAPKYALLDANRTPVLHIEGPLCICQGPCCTWDQDFNLFSSTTGEEVGKISKQWSGFVKEYFTSADNFGVSFPADLDVKMKATCLAAVFLIDFMFFEQKNNNQNN